MNVDIYIEMSVRKEVNFDIVSEVWTSTNSSTTHYDWQTISVFWLFMALTWNQSIKSRFYILFTLSLLLVVLNNYASLKLLVIFIPQLTKTLHLIVSRYAVFKSKLRWRVIWCAKRKRMEILVYAKWNIKNRYWKHVQDRDEKVRRHITIRSLTTTIMDIIHCPVFCSKHDVSDIGFYLHLPLGQPAQLDPVVTDLNLRQMCSK
jgi:hypothetical protein